MIEEAYAFEKVMKRKQDIISLTESKETSIQKCENCGREFDISKPPYNGRKHYYCSDCWRYAANAEGLKTENKRRMKNEYF